MQPSPKQPSHSQPSITAPGNLYNANIALCLRVNELMQIGGQQWVESGTRLIENAVTESKAGSARVDSHAPGALATTATGDALQSRAKRWSVHVQAASSMAVEQQRSLSTNLREAVTTWGKTVNGSLAGNGGITPFTDAWLAEMTKWTQAWSVVGKAK